MQSFPKFLTALLFCMVAPFLTAKAQSEDVSNVDVTGEWSFVANTGPECTFSGSAFLTATSKPNRFGCQLTALQVCSVSSWQVRQTCEAYRTGNELVIVSKIVEFVEGQDNGQYRPDNFRLTIRTPNLMKGVLVSWGFHSAEFIREEGTTS